MVVQTSLNIVKKNIVEVKSECISKISEIYFSANIIGHSTNNTQTAIRHKEYLKSKFVQGREGQLQLGAHSSKIRFRSQLR